MDGQETRVLVSAASKHGATREIADRIAGVIRGKGHHVDVLVPDEVGDLTAYAGVVLGSAVYAGHWLPAAIDLSHRLSDGRTSPACWLFSSGPVGDPPKPEEDPVDVAELLERLSALGHRVFSGKIDKSKLSFGEKAIVVAFRAPEGDFRNWDEIDSWAADIADTLVLERSRT